MERLILCGGGHVSLALAQIAALLEFDVVVVDDRAAFANTQRFPMASQVLALPFLEAMDQLGNRCDDYYVIVTRGHVFDQDCLRHVLAGQYTYVGMIGSRGKVAAGMEALRGEGISRERLDEVHAPIGLKLGGQTPAEVAVSIAAELIQVRAAHGGGSVPPVGEAGVLCTIVKKAGSAPRGVGAWMLVRPDGTAEGTIGGGAVELQAAKDARALYSSGESRLRKVYDLSPGAAELGMVCGGEIEVEFNIQRAKTNGSEGNRSLE